MYAKEDDTLILNPQYVKYAVENTTNTGRQSVTVTHFEKWLNVIENRRKIRMCTLWRYKSTPPYYIETLTLNKPQLLTF